MKPIDELRRDHAILRAKLQLVHGLLRMAPAVEFPLRELLYSVGRRWRCHVEKEQLVVDTLQGRLRGPAKEFAATLPEEHEERLRTLHLLLDLLLQRDRYSLEEVVRYAPLLIDGLREHLTNEETGLFPLIEWLEDEHEMEETAQRMQEINARHYVETHATGGGR